MVVTFNWKIGTKKVTLKDVEKATKNKKQDLIQCSVSSYLDDNAPPKLSSHL